MAPEGLGTKEQYTWDSQEAFLSFMGTHGTMGKACELSGAHPESVRRWKNTDTLGFADRFRQSQAAYSDYLEDMVHDRLTNPTGNRGSDVLLMARLNAERPDKWSRNVKMTHDVPNELIAQLQRLQALEPVPAPKALEAGTEAEVMPWEQ